MKEKNNNFLLNAGRKKIGLRSLVSCLLQKNSYSDHVFRFVNEWCHRQADSCFNVFSGPGVIDPFTIPRFIYCHKIVSYGSANRMKTQRISELRNKTSRRSFFDEACDKIVGNS